MGTRHVILVWYKGKWHIGQYGQLDGYPEYQGIQIVHFITNRGGSCPDVSEHVGPAQRSAASILESNNITALKAAFDSDMLYVPTEKQLEEIWNDAEHVGREAQIWIRENISRESSVIREGGSEQGAVVRLSDQYAEAMEASSRPMMFVEPSLVRDAGFQILNLVARAKDKVPIQIETDFIVNSSCEWGYVIDLDDEVFEIYSGYSRYGSDERAEREKSLQDLQPTSDLSGRFDEEEFVKKQGKRPSLVLKYNFQELVGLTAAKLVADVKAVIRYGEDDELSE